MRRFPIFLLSLAALAVPTTSWEASTSANLAINVTAGQAITAVSLSNSTFTGGAASGTVVGAISVTMSPSSPAFSGSLSLSGTNASQFQIVGSSLATNGAVPSGTYDINIVATEAGVAGSPFAQAEAIIGTSPPPTGAQKPGPSQALFNSPYYSCVRNFYVATTGSDSNNGTSPSTPWLTIQHADTSSRTAGDCINVAPGTYASGAVITHGGSSATSSGYVVYRCTAMDACVITEDDHGFETTNAGTANYLIFDGFELAASSQHTYGQGFELTQPGGPLNNANGHHYWVLNNIVHGYGQAGFQGGQADFVYVIHNMFFDNSHGTCDARGSGISMAWPIALSGYTLTNDDKSNAVTGNLASQGDYFRQVYSWNKVYNNYIGNCFVGQTDGNGIIMDTWNGNPGSGPGVYAHQGLISFNVTYNNGGAGIQLASVDNGAGTPGAGITVANNTSFNNFLDTMNNGSARAEIYENGGSNDTFINNIAYAIRAGGTCSGSNPLACNNTYIGDSSGGLPSAFSHNVGYWTGSDAGEGMYNGAVWVTGQEPANPKWANVGNTSTGSETTAPVGANFALQSGSPAIGYGQLLSYLPPTAIDAGACPSAYSTCP